MVSFTNVVELGLYVGAVMAVPVLSKYSAEIPVNSSPLLASQNL